MNILYNGLKVIVLGLVAVSLWALLSYFNVFNSPTPTLNTKIETVGPSVDTVIQTSISSIQTQSQLLVMTSRMNAVATSTTSSMGLTAKQTNIQSADIQYLLDLSQVTSSNIKVTNDNLTVTLPATALLVKPLPAFAQEEYNNGSWLFNVSAAARTELVRANQWKIKQSLAQQGSQLRSQASSNARRALVALFESPLRAAGFKQEVEVILK